MRRESNPFWDYSLEAYAVAAVADWQRQVVLPLRQVRRYIKAGIPAVPMPRTEPLRQTIAAVEFDAEYLEQFLLAQFVAGKSFAVRRPKPEGLIIVNLRRYLDLLDIRPEPSTQRQLEMLQEACPSKRAA